MVKDADTHRDAGGGWVPPPPGVVLVRIGETSSQSTLEGDVYVQIAGIADIPALIHRSVRRR